MQNEKPIQVVHALPGRVRLKLFRLKHNIPYATEIQRQLREIPGITHLEANPKTGSVLIEYDQNVLEVLELHPSVSSCLGLPLSNLTSQVPNVGPSRKEDSASLNLVRKGNPKMKEKVNPKKSSRKIKGQS